MALYAIGDLQGCQEALLALLDTIAFDPGHDRLWFAGDLVNRGPDSLQTLRFVKSLGDAAESVLGNHDLHLLAVANGLAKAKAKEGLQQVLEAPDRDELLDWVRQRPVMLESRKHRAVLTHAGIPPCWSLKKARRCARELETAIRSSDLHTFLADMYGDIPAGWQKGLRGTTRLRVITNYFTRMRVCTPEAELDFAHKEGLEDIPDGFSPWYQLPARDLQGYRVLFGHWAALMGNTGSEQFIGLDTGCVWGGFLTAYRLDDGMRFTTRTGCPVAAARSGAISGEQSPINA